MTSAARILHQLLVVLGTTGTRGATSATGASAAGAWLLARFFSRFFLCGFLFFCGFVLGRFFVLGAPGAGLTPSAAARTLLLGAPGTLFPASTTCSLDLRRQRHARHQAGNTDPCNCFFNRVLVHAAHPPSGSKSIR